MSGLDEFLLCSIVDYVPKATNVCITIDQTMRDVTGDNISSQIKNAARLRLKEGMTLLKEPTRRQVQFNETIDISCKARLGEMSTETFQDVAKHFGKY